MVEKEKQDLVQKLKKLGYHSVRQKGRYTTIYVLGDRHQHFENICKKLKTAHWNHQPTSHSGMGEIIFGDHNILVKPAGQQGTNAPGVANERLFLSHVQKALKQYKKINLEITGANGRTLLVKNVHNIVMSYSNYGQRSDFLIQGDRHVNVAIKKDDAHYWSRIESYFGARASDIIKQLKRKRKLKVTKRGTDNLLSHEIVYQPNTADIKYAVFGTDNSKIVKKTFKKQDFTIVKQSNGGYVLKINATFVATRISDLKNDHAVLFLIRNARGRKPRLMPAGITAMAIIPARVNNSAILVKS